MGAAAIVVGASLVIILVISAAVTLMARKWVFHRRDETPEDRYRRAVRDVRRFSDGPPLDEPRIWPPDGGYSASGV